MSKNVSNSVPFICVNCASTRCTLIIIKDHSMFDRKIYGKNRELQTSGGWRIFAAVDIDRCAPVRMQQVNRMPRIPMRKHNFRLRKLFEKFRLCVRRAFAPFYTHNTFNCGNFCVRANRHRQVCTLRAPITRSHVNHSFCGYFEFDV